MEMVLIAVLAYIIKNPANLYFTQQVSRMYFVDNTLKQPCISRMVLCQIVSGHVKDLVRFSKTY